MDFKPEGTESINSESTQLSLCECGWREGDGNSVTQACTETAVCGCRLQWGAVDAEFNWMFNA